MLYGVPINYEGVCNVEASFRTYFKLLTNKAMSLFKLSGTDELEAFDERYFMEQLILRGKVAVAQFDGKLYALAGNWGGEPNAYYEPTQWIVANPILGSKTLKVLNKDGSKDTSSLDGVVIALTDFDFLSENLNGGLYPLIYKYSGLLADNDVSLNVAQINGRLSVVLTADSENIANQAEDVLKDLYNGKPYRVLYQDLMDRIQVNPVAAAGTNNTIMSLIEAKAHLLQDFYNEMGIGYQGQMKRERVNEAEIGLMTGCLDISLWNMLKNLKAGIEQVNELFGTNISIELNDEVFYVGSGNATLGEDAEPQTEEAEEDPVEEETEELVDNEKREDLKEKGEDTNGKKEGEE